MPLGKSRCSFKNCENKRSSTHLSFFRFPVNDEVRCQKWVERSGNKELLHMDGQQLRREVVCAAHFDQVGPYPPHRLGAAAIPNFFADTPRENLEVDPKLHSPSETLAINQSSTLTKGEKPSTSSPPLTVTSVDVGLNNSTSQKPVNLTQSVMKPEQTLKRILRFQRWKLKDRLKTIKELRKKIRSMEKSSAKMPYLLAKLPEIPRTFVNMQLERANNCRKEYNEEEKALALRLHEKSPLQYRTMIEDGFKLPSLKTCRNWRAESAGVEGDHTYVNLKQMIKRVMKKDPQVSPTEDVTHHEPHNEAQLPESVMNNELDHEETVIVIIGNDQDYEDLQIGNVTNHEQALKDLLV